MGKLKMSDLIVKYPVAVDIVYCIVIHVVLINITAVR